MTKPKPNNKTVAKTVAVVRNTEILDSIIDIPNISLNLEQIFIKARKKLELGTFKYEYSQEKDSICGTEYKYKFIGDVYKLEIEFYDQANPVSHIIVQLFKHESLIFSYMECDNIFGANSLFSKEMIMRYLEECKDVKDNKSLNNILNIVRNLKS